MEVSDQIHVSADFTPVERKVIDFYRELRIEPLPFSSNSRAVPSDPA
jgi:hypothetical protein